MSQYLRVHSSFISLNKDTDNIYSFMHHSLNSKDPPVTLYRVTALQAPMVSFLTWGQRASSCEAANLTNLTPSSLLDMEQARLATSTSLLACSINTCPYSSTCKNISQDIQSLNSTSLLATDRKFIYKRILIFIKHNSLHYKYFHILRIRCHWSIIMQRQSAKWVFGTLLEDTG